MEIQAGQEWWKRLAISETRFFIGLVMTCHIDLRIIIVRVIHVRG